LHHVAAQKLGTLISTILNIEHDITLNTAGLRGDSLAIVGLEFAAIISQYFGSLLIAWTTTEVALTVRYRLFRKLTQLPISYFDREPLGRTITRLTSDVEGMEQFFSATLAKVVIGIIRIIGVLIAMVVVDIKLGSVAVLACLPSLIFPIITKGPLRDGLHTVKRLTARANTMLAEFIAARPIIRHLGLETWSFRRYLEENKQLYSAHRFLMNMNAIIRPFTVMLCSLPVLVVILYGGSEHLAGVIEIATLVTFLRLSERFVGPIRTISQEIQVIQDALASSERVAKMLVEPEEKESHGLAKSSGQHQALVQGKVEFIQVSMSYKPGTFALSNVSFMIPAGSTVGLVGRTGSGKSTTISLIAALYSIHAGEILVDDIHLENWNRQALRRQIGIINQDVEIFRGSLRDNLLVQERRDLADQELLAICEKVELMDVVRRHPLGLDQPLQERGRNLSAGEKQLIAFGRLLLRNPKILILDEATSHIDQAMEDRLHRVVKNNMQGRTCFLIAHRLQTIQDCDQILVYLQNTIVERGTYQELVAQNGYFAKLHASGGEVDAEI
jgi:ATP-binding cassette subfamily B multidrug efflux pump